jgi:hypothetical protein
VLVQRQLAVTFAIMTAVAVPLFIFAHSGNGVINHDDLGAAAAVVATGLWHCIWERGWGRGWGRHAHVYHSTAASSHHHLGCDGLDTLFSV